MTRLTTNKSVSEMSMIELAHNSCYVKDRWAEYRDYETDIDARELAGRLLKEHAGWDDDFDCGEDFEDCMADFLQLGLDDIEGLIAVFYRNIWAMADLRERLKYYEDLEEQGKLLELPCAVGDKLYEPGHESGMVTEHIINYIGYYGKDFEIFIGWNPNSGINDSLSGVYAREIGRTVFLTREEAEESLEKMEDGNEK